MTEQEKLKKLQDTCTDILYKFDDVCKKHNLTYYLAYGTLLGAVRHKGFIPWDDDVDIYMPRKDMEFLLACCADEFNEPYRINHYSTEYFESASFNLRIGNMKAQIKRPIGNSCKLIDVWISIFPIDDAPDNPILMKLFDWKVAFQYIQLRFVRSAHSGYGKVHHSFKEKIGMGINTLIPIFKNEDVRKIAEKINRTLKKYNGNVTSKKAIFSYGVDPSFYYEAAWFGSPTYLQFGERMLPCPSNYDAVLRFCYGNYMQLPPLEKQKPAHGIDVEFFD